MTEVGLHGSVYHQNIEVYEGYSMSLFKSSHQHLHEMLIVINAISMGHHLVFKCTIYTK